MTPEEAVRGRLLATSAVIALVSTRIFMLVLPQQPTLPAIRIQLIDDPQTKHLRGPNGLTASRVQVDVFETESASNPYPKVVSISDAVNDALVNEPFTVGSPAEIQVSSAERVDRRPMYEAGELRLVRMLNDYIVWSKPVN